MKQSTPCVREEVAVSGCDTAALVSVSEQFAELELEMVRRSEITAAQVAIEKNDWALVGIALKNVYQSFCNDEIEEAKNALKSIEHLLAKRGILVPPPTSKPQSSDTQEEKSCDQ
ncbi:MAG: hypothetical protein RSD41_05450 [Kiritimatiellia bacterium]